MSRFMIGKQYQGKGYSKQAVVAFLDYFKKKHNADRLYISVSLDNAIARRMYYDLMLYVSEGTPTRIKQAK